MLDVAVAYNRFKFIGSEFLTWLWFKLDTDPHFIDQLISEPCSLSVGNRLVLENHLRQATETITIKGDDAGLEEGKVALKKGAQVTEMSVCYRLADNEWSFTLKGESLNISNLKTPDIAPMETSDDGPGVILEKIYLLEKAIELIDMVYLKFISLRLSTEWKTKTTNLITNWIYL